MEQKEDHSECRSWRDHVKQSWLVNAVLIPLAISFICAYCMHWIR